MRSPPFRRRLPLLLAILVGCDSGGDRILGVEATGAIVGLVFLDRDGDATLDPAVDGPLAGAHVTLLLRGGDRVIADAKSGGDGGFVLLDVPVGAYSLALDSLTLGDTLRVLRVDPGEVVVSRGDTLLVTLAAGRPVTPVADARSALPGRRVAVEGVALNGWGTFADSSVHVADATGVIRALHGMAPGVVAGDSVRVLAEVGEEGGHPVLLQPEFIELGRGQAPPASTVSSAVAAGAGGGKLDATLVRVVDAAIVDARVTAAGDLSLQIDDGSGMLEVLVDRNASVTPEIQPLPGARVDVTGLLAPTGTGKWRLKPRSSRDLDVRIPLVTLSELRSLPTGRLVSVEVVALNGWATFGDSNLHLADATGYALAVRVPPSFVFAGDKIRLHGIAGVFNGWPALLALEGSPATILAQRQPVTPVQVTTGTAATAEGGLLNAGLVRISGASVSDTTSLGADFLLEVDDGSGVLEVLLENEAGVSSQVFPPGAVLDITGLLVPLPGGRAWVLRPRSRDDILRQ